MNLGFPSRFLKKLSIYQQIRNGQGISKHKKLWKYEASFLQTAYGKSHQNLNSFLKSSKEKNDLVDWIRMSCLYYDGNNYGEIMGNLLWKGYIEVKKIKEPEEKDNDSNEDKKEKKTIKDEIKINEILNNKKFGVSNKFLISYFTPRVTKEGLLVGEVVSEINKNFWGYLKYSLVLNLIWILIIIGIVKIFFEDFFELIPSIFLIIFILIILLILIIFHLAKYLEIRLNNN